jgi:hypothetical protein
MTVDTISQQKVSGILRKAGFVASKWHASSRVRGWGNETAGVKVYEDYQGRVAINYTFGNSARNVTSEQMRAEIAKIEKALTDAEIPHYLNDDEDGVIIGMP